MKPPTWKKLALVAALVGCLGLGDVAVAGQTCEPYVPSAIAVSKGLELAKRSRDVLEASGAEVALIARAGQDLTQYHLRYSHMGFVWRDHPDGRWTVVHELNECGSATSSLYDQGLGNFFLDTPFRYEALVLIPDAETQHRLVTMLQGRQPQALHDTHYNVVAYPFSTSYQNSNQWLLEVLAVAMAQDPMIDDRFGAQRWLKDNGYRPTTLEIPATTRLGARMFRANVAFDDHPFDRRMAGQIDAVTVDSVVAFARQRGIASDVRVVTLPPPVRTTAQAPVLAAPPSTVGGD